MAYLKTRLSKLEKEAGITDENTLVEFMGVKLTQRKFREMIESAQGSVLRPANKES